MADIAVGAPGGRSAEMDEVSPAEQRKVVFASSLGTVFEWYDFYLYGSLAAVIGKHFFSGLTPTAQFIAALMGFAAGFFVRPFGAIFFGRLGDLIGRKYTFLVTILLMGLSTFVVGILPGYESIGIAAPIILIVLRLMQGLALGGEYGGAAIYVAEHAENHRRGYRTAWIQTTATLGLFMSLLVILACRQWGGANFDTEWGAWRIPFLVSIVLLGISVWIRMTLNESPLFKKMKEEGRTSKAPLAEAFGEWKYLKVVILALLGGVAGQAVVWYTGQFYALFFLTQTLKVDPYWANIMIAVSLAIGTPFFLFFGWLSDVTSRKWIILAGCALAIFTYFPLFKALTWAANPELAQAAQTSPVTITADPATCKFQFNPVGQSKFTTPCDVAKSALVRAGVPYSNEAIAGPAAQIKIGATVVDSYDGAAPDAKDKAAAFNAKLAEALKGAGYPPKSKIAGIDWQVVGILTILVIYVTMVYGPMAAFLVELFPTRIRYTAMSLPYHIGNGWFGGFLPTTAFAMVAATGDIYYGLWYPIVVASMTLIIGAFFLKDSKGHALTRDDG
jgi:MFS family permease